MIGEKTRHFAGAEGGGVHTLKKLNSTVYMGTIALKNFATFKAQYPQW